VPVPIPVAKAPAAAAAPPDTYEAYESESDDAPSQSEPEDDEELMDTFAPPIGAIDKENELDLERAIPDPSDPEVITVPHK
jgi:hypothetical protein